MTEPIRVLHVIGVMNRGGAETMIMNLYRHIDREKVQFDFVECSSEPAIFDEEIQSLGGRIFRCPRYRGKNHLAYTKWWNDFFKKHKQEFRIVHGHIGSTAAIYLRIAKKYGLYTIAHSHSMINQINVRSLMYSAFSYPTRFIADGFFTCSRQAGISRYGVRIGSDETRCIQLNNAIDMQRFVYSQETRDKIRRDLNLENCLIVGHVGRFDHAKNQAFVLKVFRAIAEKRRDAALLLIGDGELRPEIERLAGEYGIRDSVVFAGVVDNVNEYLQAMDVMVFPSLYEGLPVSLIEAQASGLPCCISDTIPAEVKITDCIEFLPLSKPAEEWADEALEKAKRGREDTGRQIAEAGYDIRVTSAWLTQFYLEAAKKNGK